MDLLQPFIRFIKEEELFQRNHLLLLAVSGGVDSVVLCDLCRQAGFRFMIAHCNFQLRGGESTRDATFVRSLAQGYRVPLLLKTFDTYQFAEQNKLSIQVAARQLRYTWFKELLRPPYLNEKAAPTNKDERHSIESVQVPACLLTAHHADDNLETMMMNLFKGTGISGLRGILPRKGKIIRPLLFARKADILAYASTHQLQFVEDSSNDSDKYTRNYFRNQLIPGLQKAFPKVEENLLNSMQRFRETETLYHQAVAIHKKKLLEVRGKEIFIPVLKLKKLVPLHTVVYEIVKEFGFTAHQVPDILGLLDAETGKLVQSTEYRMIKNRGWLILSPMDTRETAIIVIDHATNKMHFDQGLLEIKEVDINHCQLATSPLVAQLDAKEIIFPILLRRWKQADYFYPLGMQKKKKLNRFLSDQKMSVTEKERTWLLEVNKMVIWIIGKRCDDRFKITSNTKRVLQITFTPYG